MPGQKQDSSASPKDKDSQTPEEKTLFSWNAASRPYKKRDRQFWVTIIAIAAVFGFILFIIEGAMPVILIISLVFLFYVLSTVEPEQIEYRITNYGVRIAESLNAYDLLTRYWFTKRLGSDLLVFEIMAIPGRLELVYHSKDTEKIQNALKKYLTQEKTSPSNIDKATNWVSEKLPGNK
ncbi:MAG: hypothetical protein US53_C0022G0009 [Candidatus Woesebacteria bacterium GW2011_GWA1_37_7]|uniref:DUF5673 domain-containing protein n=2 Tax=Candidatus Woeseibacteriota TaxID=1752722 RepID=A0A0G0JKM3_9BACT|nr:MAG: hypothetical protein US53_C0022G0009 [Candidatus Woesebacteria bacterium GW2011_GWA1_37_7]OGM18615.1 MAG: hypothetical protein A2685_00200 [Candidatus Woesebacteria bacterium RIFCSPHIGHO2_01_FULL_37_10]